MANCYWDKIYTCLISMVTSCFVDFSAEELCPLIVMRATLI